MDIEQHRLVAQAIEKLREKNEALCQCVESNECFIEHNWNWRVLSFWHISIIFKCQQNFCLCRLFVLCRSSRTKSGQTWLSFIFERSVFAKLLFIHFHQIPLSQSQNAMLYLCWTNFEWQAKYKIRFDVGFQLLGMISAVNRLFDKFAHISK